MSALCGALADIGGDAAARALVSLIGRSGAYAVSTALQRVGATAGPHLLEAYAGNPVVRRAFAELVAAIAGPAALGPFLAALYDTDAEVRTHAVKGLQALGPVVVEPLLQLLASGYLMPRPDAIRVLAHFADDHVFRSILEIAAICEMACSISTAFNC